MLIKRALIIVCLLYLTAPSFCQTKGEEAFYSQRLRKIASQIALDSSIIHKDTIILAENFSDHPISVKVVDGKIVNIGFNIFDQHIKENISENICDFIERYSLEMLLPEEDGLTMENKIGNDNVVIHKGSFKALIKANDSLDVFLNSYGDNYNFKCHSGNDVILDMTFPNQYTLLIGANQVELENIFIRELKKSNPDYRKSMNISPDNLVPTVHKGIFMYEKGHYLIDTIISSLYFTNDTSDSIPRHHLVFSPEYPLESFYNLMSTTEIENQYQIDLYVKKKIYDQDFVSCTIPQWLDFCFSDNCTPYIGIESFDNRIIKATIIMVNQIHNYNHVCLAYFDVNTIPQKKGSFKMTVHPYVPTHNVSNLYNEKNI